MELTKVDRRVALKTIAQTASMCAVGTLASVRGAGQPHSLGNAVDIVLDESIGTIKPALYGQFAEHLGGVIYDGIWVGPDSKVPNIGGIRQALVEHVRRLGHVVIRWPGGCFADAYHWRDGIGPPRQRRGVLAAGARKPSRIFSARMSSCSSAACARSSLTSLPTWARDPPKNSSSGSNTAMRPPAERRWPTSAWPTATGSRSGSAIGVSATRVGAAAASLRPRIIARSTASSRTGCRTTECILTSSRPGRTATTWIGRGGSS